MRAVNTNNYYGNISISGDAIAVVAGFCALECYGVIDLVSHSIKDSVIYCILKYGVSLSAVGENLKKAVKCGVENFTGMIVDAVNVHVCGVQV